MDELIAINKVSMEYNISSRTLRYWEEAGLFTSTRDAQSGWRMYDDYALQCIRITNLLRHFDFSINEIKEIIEKQTVDSLRQVLKKQLSKLNKTSSDLEKRKEAINELIVILETELSFTLSSLENILLPVALERKKHIISKLHGGFQMESIKSKFDEVKYVNLAPARAVAFNSAGKDVEDRVYSTVMEWIEKNNLRGTARIYLYNSDPWPTEETPDYYGMGCCATIPEGIEIPEPLYEKRMPGGIYAVISDYEGDPSYGWRKIGELMNDKDWEWEYDGDRGCVGLEEHIWGVDGFSSIPVMLPVRKKVK